MRKYSHRTLMAELSAANERLPLAGKRPVVRHSRPTASDFGLLGDLERVIDLDAKVSHSAFELRGQGGVARLSGS